VAVQLAIIPGWMFNLPNSERIIMPLTFPQRNALFRQDRLNELVADVEEGVILKRRSLNRTEYLERLFQAQALLHRCVERVTVRCLRQCRKINTQRLSACARDILCGEREQRSAPEKGRVGESVLPRAGIQLGGLRPETVSTKTIVDNT